MQNGKTLVWDDLRLALAIARGRGLSGAARALGVNHSTVFRRLAGLEDGLGVRLFERQDGRYAPTPAGERIIAAAMRIEDEALAAERAIVGRDLRLSGRLRVTASETLAHRMLVRIIAAFHARNPAVQVELVLDHRLLSLSRREADVALRARRPVESDLFGRKLADVDWALYACAGYLAARGRPRGPADYAVHHWIGWEDTGAPIRSVEWLARSAPEDSVVFRCNSLVTQMMAARAGMGIAPLPCYIGDKETELERIGRPLPDLRGELWIVTHEDLRRSARVRAFLEFVGDAVMREITGRAAPARRAA
jgi:DNA-binding transcriptional LysR family regulator